MIVNELTTAHNLSFNSTRPPTTSRILSSKLKTYTYSELQGTEDVSLFLIADPEKNYFLLKKTFLFKIGDGEEPNESHEECYKVVQQEKEGLMALSLECPSIAALIDTVTYPERINKSCSYDGDIATYVDFLFSLPRCEPLSSVLDAKLQTQDNFLLLAFLSSFYGKIQALKLPIGLVCLHNHLVTNEGSGPVQTEHQDSPCERLQEPGALKFEPSGPNVKAFQPSSLVLIGLGLIEKVKKGPMTNEEVLSKNLALLKEWTRIVELGIVDDSSKGLWNKLKEASSQAQIEAAHKELSEITTIQKTWEGSIIKLRKLLEVNQMKSSPDCLLLLGSTLQEIGGGEGPLPLNFNEKTFEKKLHYFPHCEDHPNAFFDIGKHGPKSKFPSPRKIKEIVVALIIAILLGLVGTFCYYFVTLKEQVGKLNGTIDKGNKLIGSFYYNRTNLKRARTRYLAAQEPNSTALEEFIEEIILDCQELELILNQTLVQKEELTLRLSYSESVLALTKEQLQQAGEYIKVQSRRIQELTQLWKDASNNYTELLRKYNTQQSELVATAILLNECVLEKAELTNSFTKEINELKERYQFSANIFPMVLENSVAEKLKGFVYKILNLEAITDMVITKDGGIFIAGTILRKTSSGVQVDVSVSKMGADGSVIWEKTITYPGSERIYSVSATSDGGFILAGNRIPGYYIYTDDLWIEKMDSNGVTEWTWTYPYSIDGAHSIIESSDGCYVITGSISEPSNTQYQYLWVIKLDKAKKSVMGNKRRSSSRIWLQWKKRRKINYRNQRPRLYSNRICGLRNDGSSENKTSRNYRIPETHYPNLLLLLWLILLVLLWVRV
eukprot:TRINITY_DN3542_c0_g1_i3.p1 TRINITY_DN3542_c0_g1~~TRINITY_DN3542_c0_g1_i3.p1  ORF type:complete len:838 (+),score=99.20 TRINITY_DN3542_c0_g1_i3:52-2565(+)